MSFKAQEKALPFVDPSEFDKQAFFDQIGYHPDNWQKRFHDSPARHRILACGVRVGKTFTLAAEAAAAVVCPSKKSREANEWVGSRVWIVAPTYDTADKLFRMTASYLRRHVPWIVTSYSERDRVLKTIGGGYLQGKSAENSDSLASEELDAAILDEAPRIGEFEKEQVRQRLITREGWFAAIGSPVPCKWFQRDWALGQGAGYDFEFEGEALVGCRIAGQKVRFVKGAGDPDPNYFSMRVPTHANERLSLDVLREWERTMPERILRQDVLAEFMGNEGQVFKDFDRLVTPTGRLLNGLPGHRYVIGWDPARTRDFSAINVMDYQTREVVFTDRFQGDWKGQTERVIKICRRFNRPDVIVDATGKGDPIAQDLMRRNQDAAAQAARPRPGYPEDALGAFAGRVEPVEMYSHAVKREIIEQLAVGIDQGLMRLIDDQILLQELRLYEFKQSDATGVIRYGAPRGVHDDTVMALALAWWRCSRPMGSASVLLF